MVEQPKDQLVQNDHPLENKPPSPKPSPSNAPPPGPLALDAKGQGAPDAFALGGNPGGADYAGGGGGGGSRFGWYSTLIKNHVEDTLRQQARLRRARYRVAVQVWLDGQGQPVRVELMESTGAADLDELLKRALQGMSRMPEAPPADLPQPVVMEVGSS